MLFGVANSWPRADGENRKAPDALGTLAARPFIVAGTPLHVNRCSFEVKLPVRLVRFLFPSWGVWNSSIDINEDFRSEARASATGRPVCCHTRLFRAHRWCYLYAAWRDGAHVLSPPNRPYDAHGMTAAYAMPSTTRRQTCPWYTHPAQPGHEIIRPLMAPNNTSNISPAACDRLWAIELTTRFTKKRHARGSPVCHKTFSSDHLRTTEKAAVLYLKWAWPLKPRLLLYRIRQA